MTPPFNPYAKARVSFRRIIRAYRIMAVLFFGIHLPITIALSIFSPKPLLIAGLLPGVACYLASRRLARKAEWLLLVTGLYESQAAANSRCETQ